MHLPTVAWFATAENGHDFDTLQEQSVLLMGHISGLNPRQRLSTKAHAFSRTAPPQFPKRLGMLPSIHRAFLSATREFLCGRYFVLFTLIATGFLTFGFRGFTSANLNRS